MPYFIIGKESKEFGFFGSLPVMVEKLYYNNNIEVIIKNGEIVNTKLNLN